MDTQFVISKLPLEVTEDPLTDSSHLCEGKPLSSWLLFWTYAIAFSCLFWLVDLAKISIIPSPSWAIESNRRLLGNDCGTCCSSQSISSTSKETFLDTSSDDWCCQSVTSHEVHYIAPQVSMLSRNQTISAITIYLQLTPQNNTWIEAGLSIGGTQCENMCWCPHR